MPIVGYRFYGRNIRPYLADPKKKSYTILGMTLFSLIVFGAFAIRPSLFTISQLNREVKKAREAKIILDQKIKNLSQAQVNYQLALNGLELVDKALPGDASVPAILETLALAAGRNNISLEETKFGEIESKAGLETLPFTVRAVGELKNIQNFIAELENGVRQMNVQQVKMSQGGEELEQLVAEIELVTSLITQPGFFVPSSSFSRASSERLGFFCL